MKDHYTLLKDFLEKHFPAQLPKLEAIKDKPVEVIMMYNMYKRSAKNALKERVDEADKKQPLKEFTDNSFKGSELIDDANKRGPDMFGKQIFADLLPKGVASENDAIEALKAHDESGIKARMGRYAPMFVHVQYHELEHEGQKYRMHQTQYYNSNFKDKDPDFNPGVSKITLKKVDENDEGHNLGVILVKTDEYVQDLRNIPGLGKRVMEEASRINEVKEDLNDPVLMKMRAAQAAKAKKKADLGKEYGDAVQKAYNSSNLAKLNFLRKERAQLMRDMEQEAEPEGGPIADEYGSKLNRIDKAIAKLSGRKEMTYDQAIAENKILKQAKLSSAEYQKAKKLKDFNKDDYKWNPSESLYIKAVGKVNEQMDIYDDIANEEFGMDYDQLGSNEQQWVHDEIDNMPKLNEASKEEQLKVAFDALDKAEMSGDIRGVELALAAIDSIRGAYIIEAKATCCHKCGRVHVKGTPCKRPYLKGKKSCAVREVQELQERLDNLKETKSAPKGHYFTKSGNLVKGRMTKDAEERGARKSDPKDKMRSKIPKVTQYTEIVKKHIKNNPKIKKSQMTEVIKDIIQRNN